MDAKRKLKGMLARIFSDATADEAERAELVTFLSSGDLSIAEIQAVFQDFVETTWKITLADGVISETERQRLAEIVRVLGLEREALPVEWSRIVGKSVAPPPR
jgi:tellurite resistance protein